MKARAGSHTLHRMLLGTVVLCLVLPLSSAQASVAVKGSVLAPDGASADRLGYVQGGCAKDVADGHFASFFDLRGVKSIIVQIGKTDYLGPAASPALAASIYGACDPGTVNPGSPLFTPTSQCANFAANQCTLTVGKGKFLQIQLSCVVCSYASTHFTLTKVTA